MAAHGECAREGSERPRHEVADIFRAHSESYRSAHGLTQVQRRAMRAIELCRTSALGGHLDRCADCGHQRPAYNSCRDRHCPKCQAVSAARWLDRRRQRMLPVHCFHVVFTLPAQLRPIAQWNRRRVFDLLFRAASQTLLKLGRDPNRYGALLGVTAVLHTWSRDLRVHPHLHCIVTGGGLSHDGDRWIDAPPNFLFPIRVLGALFRGIFCDALRTTHAKQPLELPGALAAPGAFEDLLDTLYRKKWVVYAKRPFAGPDQVFTYLGQYTHRVGISNHRLLDVTADTVTIKTRGSKRATMSCHEFIRRFLLHVLPPGFVKVRHYGLWASGNVNTRLVRAGELLAPRQPPEADAESDPHGADDELGWKQLVVRLTGIDPDLCPACGSRRLQRSPLTATERDRGMAAAPRAPPETALPAP